MPGRSPLDSHLGATNPGESSANLASPAPSRIPAQSERRATPGTFEAPRSLIENASLFTHAELLLALMIHRIPADQNSPASISDSTWQKWTGLKPRMKEMAIKGLQTKGLEIRGRGAKARFYWDEQRWTNYIREHSPLEKARTEGRKKSVPAKAGMQIHPDCALKGCQHLCDTQACEPAKVVSIRPQNEPKNAQPVAQTACNPQILKNRERKGEDWSLSLSTLQNFFPATDSTFLQKLLTAARNRVAQFTDEQLSQAIRAARHPRQRSEGLFLQTVPGALQAVIEGRIENKPQPKPKFSEVEIKAHIEKHHAGLKRAGMDDLAQRLRLLDIKDPVKLDDALNEIESAAIERLRARAPADVIRGQVEVKLKPYLKKMSAENLQTLRERFTGEQLLSDAGLSRMSLYYL